MIILSGWLSVVAGQQLGDRLHGMLLYAPALNYVYPYYKSHLDKLPAELRQRIEQGDPQFIAMNAMGSALMKKDFAMDSR